MAKRIDDTGNRYGRLLVQSCFVEKGRTRCICLCDCGNTVTVMSYNIRSGAAKSCGCLQKERTGGINRVHGDSNTKVYRAWKSIKRRCFNPKSYGYSYYGGSGITMSPLWKDDYIAFRDYIGLPPDDGKKYSVDRVDGTKGYEPGNVRWATQEQQTRNRGIYKSNTTGVNGVLFHKNCGCYVASWYISRGKRKTKYFSVNKYGKEEAFRLACEARENAIKELNDQGAGYTENHGKQGSP